MKTLQITPDTRIKAKGFDISIGKRSDQIAIINHSKDEFVPFTSIKKGGRLQKIKRIFKNRLSSSTHFFFEYMTPEDVKKLYLILK